MMSVDAMPPPAVTSPELRQLDELPAGTRWLLLLVAADEEMDAASLVHAARASGLDIAALSPAELAGLVRVAGGEVQFATPRLRAHLYEQAPLAQRRDAHLRVADAAATTGAYDRAATALARAADLTGDPEQAATRLLTAARYAWLSGAAPLARRLLRRAMTVTPSASLGGQCRLLAGEIELRAGAAATAVDTLLAAADDLARGGETPLALQALMRANEAASLIGAHSRLSQIADRATALPPHTSADATELLVTYLAGSAAALRGRHDRAASALQRCVQLGAARTDPTSLALCASAGILLADHTHAWRLADDAVEAARANGEIAELPIALLLRAFAEHWLGRPEAVAATCHEGWRIAHAGGQHNYASDHLAMLAVHAAIRGAPGHTRRYLRQVTIPPGAGTMCRPRALREWALAVLDVCDGRPDDAVDRLTSMIAPDTSDGQVAIFLLATPWLVEAARHGDPAPAFGALACFDQWAGSTGGPLVQALSARCHALLAPRGSDAAERGFTEALRLHDDSESEFERARTELLFGQELRRSRRPRDSRIHLHRARDIFTHLHLPTWAARATAELRAAGEQVDDPTATGELTAQQRQIAQLVADGATNREIAAQLHVSPRTVDHHLRNIFVKLQIRSRVELARRLPERH